MSDTAINQFVASGTAAERALFVPDPPTPAGSLPDNGYFWFETDTGLLYSWDGAVWATVAGSGGDVTHTGALTANALVLGNGTDDIAALGSLGTTTTVLHGNAAGAPTFGAVSLSADVSGDLPFANLTAASAASKLLGRGDSGAGDYEEITLGTGLTMTGTTLSASGGGGGGGALSDITAASAANTIASGNNHSQVWNWALTSNNVIALVFGETTAATNGASTTQALVGINTLANSTATALYIKNYGEGHGIIVDDVSGDTQPFVVSKDGRVGIYAASPAYALDIGNDGTDGGIRVKNDYITGGIGLTRNRWGSITAEQWYLAYNGQRIAKILSSNMTLLKSAVPTTFDATSPYLMLGDDEKAVNGYYTIGFGYTNAVNDGSSSIVPAIIGFQETDNTSQTKGSLIFATRDVTTSTAPTVRLTIAPAGAATFTHNVDAASYSVGAAAGASGTFTNSITVVNGIVTSGS